MINAINSIPAGELDGGRISFAIWGRKVKLNYLYIVTFNVVFIYVKVVHDVFYQSSIGNVLFIIINMGKLCTSDSSNPPRWEPLMALGGNGMLYFLFAYACYGHLIKAPR